MDSAGSHRIRPEAPNLKDITRIIALQRRCTRRRRRSQDPRKRSGKRKGIKFTHMWLAIRPCTHSRPRVIES